jgi:superfamily I DNA/RNA helicase
MRHLINPAGDPFDPAELAELRRELDTLPDGDRLQFRNDNAKAIAEHEAECLLIVSGPGTGKSTVFKQRVVYWFKGSPDARILVLSFVRKLVMDLYNDIQLAPELTERQKLQVDVHTLHRYARSVVERNHGNSEIQFEPHLQIISPYWKAIVWRDAQQLVGQRDDEEFSFKEFERQLHDWEFEGSDDWRRMKDAYFTLSKFYNAAGFADLIIHATTALSENSHLREHELFIIDEYQDFNAAEDGLIEELTNGGKGKLKVGDDDQVLYETLKRGKPDLIRELYADEEYVNAMLPYCSRSKSVNIVKAAEHFLQHELDANSIPKIYLPLRSEGGEKVHVIGSATPSAAVDYVRAFIDEHKQSIEQRKLDLEAGTAKDPYLLILTPQRGAKFYAVNGADVELQQLVATYRAELDQYSEDYFAVLTYYSLAKNPENNFTFRKVLNYASVPRKTIIALLRRALDEGAKLSALRDSEPAIDEVLNRCESVKAIIDADDPIEEKVRKLGVTIHIDDPARLIKDFERHALNEKQVERVELEEETEAERDELDVQRLSAVELMTLWGAKGLSADHVMIIGFDDVNMARVTRNAFYVALTRARESLHLLTAHKARGGKWPHPFLGSLPEEHLEFHKYTKKGHILTPLASSMAFVKYFKALNWATSQPKPAAKTKKR